MPCADACVGTRLPVRPAAEASSRRQTSPRERPDVLPGAERDRRNGHRPLAAPRGDHAAAVADGQVLRRIRAVEFRQSRLLSGARSPTSTEMAAPSSQIEYFLLRRYTASARRVAGYRVQPTTRSAAR